MLNFDKTKLLEVLKAFEGSTGARVAIYNEDFIEIVSYPQKQCELCTNLRKIPAIDKMCNDSDERAFNVCKSTQKVHMYECNMGLFEAVAPIILHNHIEGYIMMGQVTSSHQEVLRRANKYISDTSDISVLLSKMPTISYQNLESISFLMNLCVEYLCMSNFILKASPRAKKIDDYILQNLDKKLYTDDIADFFNISRATLHNITKEAFDMSITERINFLRINKSKNLLMQGKTIDEICVLVGFCDRNYFYKNFKKYTNLTVKEFLFENSLTF